MDMGRNVDVSVRAQGARNVGFREGNEEQCYSPTNQPINRHNNTIKMDKILPSGVRK